MQRTPSQIIREIERIRQEIQSRRNPIQLTVNSMEDGDKELQAALERSLEELNSPRPTTTTTTFRSNQSSGRPLSPRRPTNIPIESDTLRAARVMEEEAELQKILKMSEDDAAHAEAIRRDKQSRRNDRLLSEEVPFHHPSFQPPYMDPLHSFIPPHIVDPFPPYMDHTSPFISPPMGHFPFPIRYPLQPRPASFPVPPPLPDDVVIPSPEMQDEDEILRRVLQESEAEQRERERQKEIDRIKEEKQREREKQKERDRIKEEQDLEYLESLAIDQSKREEEERIQRALEAMEKEREQEEQRKVEELQRKHEEEEEKQAIHLSMLLVTQLPPEPDPKDPKAVKLVIQLPGSQGRVERNFLPDNTLGEVRKFVDTRRLAENGGLAVPTEFILVKDYPRKVWGEEHNTVTLLEAGFSRRELLRVEPLVVNSTHP